MSISHYVHSIFASLYTCRYIVLDIECICHTQSYWMIENHAINPYMDPYIMNSLFSRIMTKKMQAYLMRKRKCSWKFYAKKKTKENLILAHSLAVISTHISGISNSEQGKISTCISWILNLEYGKISTHISWISNLEQSKVKGVQTEILNPL